MQGEKENGQLEVRSQSKGLGKDCGIKNAWKENNSFTYNNTKKPNVTLFKLI